MKIDGLTSFVAVAETRSITEAARRLEVSKSVVSDRLIEFERSLGVTLLRRTTRKVALTEEGSRFLERAHRILREIDDATDEIAERQGALRGALRIAAPVSFGSLHVGPALYPFLAAHPDIEVDLSLDDRFVDAPGDGYDAVIRHGRILDTRLVVKTLATSRRVLVASTDYLERRGTPTTLAELEGHAGIIYSNRGAADWRFERDARTVVVRAGHALRVNNGVVMRDAAVAGLGITLLPTFLVAPEIVSARLRVVDIGEEAESGVIHIACARDRRASAKVRALIDCLRDSFGDPPSWDVAIAKASAKRRPGAKKRSPRQP
jgi:DNA-binding transcriptional LysR family regulator